MAIGRDPDFFVIVGLAVWLLPSAASEWFGLVAFITTLFMPFIFVAYWFRNYAGVGDELSVWLAVAVWVAHFVTLISLFVGDTGSALKAFAVAGFTVLLGFLWKRVRGYRA